MTVTIAIPTYWGRPEGNSPQRDDAAYDHPTPVDGSSTLPRLLASLARQEETRFNVLVLTASVHPGLAQAAENRVANLIAPFRDAYPIAQFGSGDLDLLRGRAEALDFDPALFSLRGYANIRNIQLVTPHLLGSEIILALDDDEVMTADYMRRATAMIGSERQGQIVAGVAGPYLDGKGEWLLPETESSGNIFMDKAAVMNAAARRLMEDGQHLVRSPLAFGGNMIFHRDLFAQVSFDPWITRGEDLDYVLNARLHGRDFWFDPALTITHLPPQAYQSSPYAKLRQDVIRFVYEREKLAQAGVEPAQFDPYPGRFLRGDVEAQALSALRQTATPADTARLGTPQEIVALAQRHAHESAPRYQAFAATWPQLMDTLAHDRLLKKRWRASMQAS